LQPVVEALIFFGHLGSLLAIVYQNKSSSFPKSVICVCGVIEHVPFSDVTRNDLCVQKLNSKPASMGSVISLDSDNVQVKNQQRRQRLQLLQGKYLRILPSQSI